jgi:hypothetical protein
MTELFFRFPVPWTLYPDPCHGFTDSVAFGISPNISGA